MSISPIGSQPIQLPALDPGARAAGNESPTASFGAFLGQALDNLSAMEQRADQTSISLASGQPVDLHNVVLASEETSLAFSLALQLRNKAIEAYQEIMRMQV